MTRLPTSARYGRRWLLGACLGASAGLAAACSGAHEPVQHTPEAPSHPRAEVKPTANLPTLLNQPIEKLQRQLEATQVLPGSLIDDTRVTDLAPHATDSLLTFRAGGLLLIASYDIRTRRVHDLLLLGHHEDSLMQRAALRFDAPNYLVLPAFQTRRPGVLLGLRVIPIGRP